MRIYSGAQLASFTNEGAASLNTIVKQQGATKTSSLLAPSVQNCHMLGRVLRAGVIKQSSGLGLAILVQNMVPTFRTNFKN